MGGQVSERSACDPPIPAGCWRVHVSQAWLQEAEEALKELRDAQVGKSPRNVPPEHHVPRILIFAVAALEAYVNEFLYDWFGAHTEAQDLINNTRLALPSRLKSCAEYAERSLPTTTSVWNDFCPLYKARHELVHYKPRDFDPPADASGDDVWSVIFSAKGIALPPDKAAAACDIVKRMIVLLHDTTERPMRHLWRKRFDFPRTAREVRAMLGLSEPEIEALPTLDVPAELARAICRRTSKHVNQDVYLAMQRAVLCWRAANHQTIALPQTYRQEETLRERAGVAPV